jgi:hypothetical protein
MTACRDVAVESTRVPPMLEDLLGEDLNDLSSTYLSQLRMMLKGMASMFSKMVHKDGLNHVALGRQWRSTFCKACS